MYYPAPPAPITRRGAFRFALRCALVLPLGIVAVLALCYIGLCAIRRTLSDFFL